jgi:diguanylate cyclase (GGDEF)-like protein
VSKTRKSSPAPDETRREGYLTAELRQAWARYRELEASHAQLERRLAAASDANQELSLANLELSAENEQQEQRIRELGWALDEASRQSRMTKEKERQLEALRRLNQMAAREVTERRRAEQQAAGLAERLLEADALREEQLKSLRDLSDRLVREVVQRRRAEQEAARLTEQLRRANADLDRLATLDSLTELLNRRGLERQLRAERNRAQRAGAPVGVLLADLDDFKSINSNFGHAGGDAALQEVARRLRRALRAEDALARIGGDEFLAVLPGLSAAHLLTVADRFRAAASAEPVPVDPKPVPVSVSVAAAVLPPGVTTLDQILRLLKRALAASKAEGKDRVTVTGEHPRSPAAMIDTSANESDARPAV